MIVSKDINPEKSLYYLGSQVIELLHNSNDKEFDLLVLYNKFRQKNNISINLYLLVLDWLFVLGVVEQGKVKSIAKCF